MAVMFAMRRARGRAAAAAVPAGSGGDASCCWAPLLLLLLLISAFATVARAQQSPAYCAVQLRPNSTAASLRLAEIELYDDSGHLMGAADRALLLDGDAAAGRPGAQCADGDAATDCEAAPRAAAGAPPALAALFRCALGLRRVVVVNTQDPAARAAAAGLVLSVFRPNAQAVTVRLNSVRDEYVVPLAEKSVVVRPVPPEARRSARAAARSIAPREVQEDPLAGVTISVAGGAAPTYTPVLDRRGDGSVALRVSSKDAIDAVTISGMPDQISDYAVDYVNEKGAVVRTIPLVDARESFDVNLKCSVSNLPAAPANAVVTKSACSAFAGVGECSAACKSGFGGAPSATCNAAGQWSAWNGTCAPAPSCAIQIRPFDNGEPEGDALALGEVQLFDSAGQPVPITIALSSERAGYPAANCADGDPQTQCETSPYFPSRRALTAAFNCAQYPARIAVANRQGDPLLRAAITSYVVDVIYKGAVKATFPAAADAQDSYSYFAPCLLALQPPLPANAVPVVAEDCDGIEAGVACRTACKLGFTGAPAITCGNGTWQGGWSGACPPGRNCVASALPALPANANAAPASCASVKSSGACVLTCADGYAPSSPAPTATCQDGAWSAWQGVCRENACKAAELAARRLPKYTVLSPGCAGTIPGGGNCTAACVPGSGTGGYVAYCRGGRWTGWVGAACRP